MNKNSLRKIMIAIFCLMALAQLPSCAGQKCDCPKVWPSTFTTLGLDKRLFMDYIGPQMKRLTQLKKGEFAFVVDLTDPIVCLEMLDNGFFPGEKVDVLENMPEDNHILVAMNNKHYRIIKNKANSIITNVVSYDIHLN